jgi:NAD(P)-dependent dehydrogenase (short-subunit alcohol dehydrogenase family)
MNDFAKRSVLVTGASSGIGYTVAVYLAKQGYTVLATVRRNSDVEMLNKLGFNNLKPLCPLDLTKQEQIYSIANFVKEQITNNEWPSLYAIINIAGGGQIAPIELMNISGFREELEKRLVGPISLLQELLPLLRHTKGKVFWISTPGLFPVPYVADIHAPDFAVNYLARTLNLELRPDGIKNILIRCGGINTPSPKRTENNLIEKLKDCSKERVDIYKDRLVKLEKELKKFAAKRTEPEEVAELIAKVLSKQKTKVRYHVGYMSGLGAFLERLPQSWIDFIMGKREGEI